MSNLDSNDFDSSHSFDTKNISIHTLLVDFPDTSERSGRIFGNTHHNTPVRIRFKIIDTANNDKDVSEQYKNRIHLYDVSANHAIADGSALSGTVSESLIAARGPNAFTLSLYGKSSASSATLASGELTEMMLYVRTRQNVTSMRDVEIGAYVALNNEATPDGEMVSSGDKKSVYIELLPPINYADPGQWSGEEGSVTYLTPEGGMDLNGVDASTVTFCRRHFSLQHAMLKDNSPIKLSVQGAMVQGGGTRTMRISPPGLNGRMVLLATSDINDMSNSGKRQARAAGWVAPQADLALTIQPYIQSTQGNNLSVRNAIPFYTANSSVNKNSPVLTLLQAEMLIRDENFLVQNAITHNTGTIHLSDNIGHIQAVQITCDTVTGKPRIIGKG